ASIAALIRTPPDGLRDGHSSISGDVRKLKFRHTQRKLTREFSWRRYLSAFVAGVIRWQDCRIGQDFEPNGHRTAIAAGNPCRMHLRLIRWHGTDAADLPTADRSGAKPVTDYKWLSRTNGPCMCGRLMAICLKATWSAEKARRLRDGGGD